MGGLAAEWSLPVEAWLKPAPEPTLRRKGRNVDTFPDMSGNGHLTCRGLIVLCPSVVSWLELKLFEQVRTSLLSLFLSTILLSHVSSDPDAKGTFIHPVIVPPAMTLPVCLGIRARGTSVTKHTPAFLSAALSTSTRLSNMARGEVCL